jgi:hypothetical protein
MSLALGACAVNSCAAAGAYAVGKSEHSSWGGGAKDAANYQEAGRGALGRCGQYGPGCAIVAYFSQKCFSLAIPPGTGAYYWATRDTLEAARQTVVDNCRATGRSCEIKVGFCDLRGLPMVPPSIARPASVLAPSQSDRGNAPRLEVSWEPIDGRLILFAAVAISALGIAVAFRKLSFHSESDYGSSMQAAERYDREAARFRGMGCKLDAETELAESYINAKRIRAELDEIEEILSHDKAKRRR